jgi:predicted Zn-dependent peptidase
MYRKSVIGNGLRIVTEQIEHLRSVSLGIWVNAGSRDEIKEQNGISHLIEHMIFKGTGNRSSLQIAKELDAIGGLSNAFTGKENVCFHTRVLGKHFGLAAEILGDIFLNSIFDPIDLERERQVIFQEIGMLEDSPEENVHVLLHRHFWAGHPIGMPVLGTGASISAIGQQTVVDYIDKYYVPEKVLVVAAGNVDHDRVVSYFEPLFSRLAAGRSSVEKRSLPQPNPGVACHFRDLEQVHICLGGNAPPLSSEKRFVCALLNTILGGNMSSRLFQEVRENRGLAYAIYSFLSAYVDAGLMGVYVATEKDKVNQTLITIRDQIQSISNGDLSGEDLAAAKEFLIGGIYLGAESVDNRMMRLAKNEFLFERFVTYAELIDYLQEVTVDQVVEMAQEIFQRLNISLVTLGPFRREDLDPDCLSFNTV